MAGISEPFSFAAQTVAGSAGTGTITFPTAPIGQVYTGTVSIPGASPGVVGTISSGGTTWGTVGGAAPFGPVSSPGGVGLQIAFRGAVAGQSVVAVWHGRAEDSGSGAVPLPLPFASIAPWDYGQQVILNCAADINYGSAFTPPLYFDFAWSDVIIGATDTSGLKWNLPPGNFLRVNSLAASIANITAPSSYPISGTFALGLLWVTASPQVNVVYPLAPFTVQGSVSDEQHVQIGQIGVDLPVTAAPGTPQITLSVGVQSPAVSLTWTARLQAIVVCTMYTRPTVG